MLGISCTFSDNCRCLDCQVIDTLSSINEQLINNSIYYHYYYRVDTLTVMMIVTHIQIYLMLLSMKMMIY